MLTAGYSKNKFFCDEEFQIEIVCKDKWTVFVRYDTAMDTCKDAEFTSKLN